MSDSGSRPLLQATVAPGGRIRDYGPMGSSVAIDKVPGIFDAMLGTYLSESQSANIRGAVRDFAAGSSSQINLQVLTPTGSGPVTITGTPGANAVRKALILNMRDNPGGSVVLNNVNFAAVVGKGTFTGGEGSSLTIGDDEAQYFNLGPGDDTTRGGGGDDVVASTTGRDLLAGDAGNDTLNGGADNDTLLGGDDNDVAGGGTGDDLISGDAGNDTLLGEDGNDTAIGGTGNDLLFGMDGADLLTGDDGADTLLGEDGNDTAIGGTGNDLLFGMDGADLLTGDDGADTLLGGAGADSVLGGAGTDLIDGGADGDLANGGDGNDTLFGGSGNDTLFGGAGDDALWGGEGDDWLTGGAGTDMFGFTPGGGNDLVFEFNPDDDLLGFAVPGITVADLKAGARTVGNNTVFTLSDKSTVTVVGVTGVTDAWFS
ncbi:calcium-binding protein [Azospirillum sp. sgz302134]